MRIFEHGTTLCVNLDQLDFWKFLGSNFELETISLLNLKSTCRVWKKTHNDHVAIFWIDAHITVQSQISFIILSTFSSTLMGRKFLSQKLSDIIILVFERHQEVIDLWIKNPRILSYFMLAKSNSTPFFAPKKRIFPHVNSYFQKSISSNSFNSKRTFNFETLPTNKHRKVRE